MTLDELLMSHYRPARLLAGSPRTIGQYADAVRAFARSLDRPATIADLARSTVERFAAWYLAGGSPPRRPASLNAHLRTLKCLWRFAHERRFTDEPPAVTLVRDLRRTPRAWTEDDVGRILDAAEREPGWIDGVRAAEFWQALILFIYDTGLRKSTVLRLPCTSVDFARRLVWVPAEIQKHRADQVVRLSDETSAALARIYREDADYLFPWPFDRYTGSSWTTFSRRLRRIVQRAGLDTAHGVCQRLRRTRASLGERVAPGSATRDLGHSARRLTEQYYIDPAIVGVSDVVARLPRPRRGG